MAFGTRVVAFEPSAKFFSGLSERDSDASHNASRARKSPRTMHAASAPRAPFAPGARGRAARRRAPSRYLRRAATARAKISGEGRVSDSDAGEATCSARDGEGAAETRASTRQVRLFQASSAFVATATAATLALGASAPAPPLAPFFRAEAAESALLRPEAEAALAAERERDRRAAERVVDAFLALSREDQIKVVDRLVFAADADQRAAAAAAAAATETVPVSSASETFSFSSRDAPSEKTPFSFSSSSSSRDESGFGFRDQNDARATEDPFAAADARDGWPARDSNGDEKKDAKAAALLAEPSSAPSSPSFDDASADDTDDDSPSTLACRSRARARPPRVGFEPPRRRRRCASPRRRPKGSSRRRSKSSETARFRFPVSVGRGLRRAARVRGAHRAGDRARDQEHDRWGPTRGRHWGRHWGRRGYPERRRRKSARDRFGTRGSRAVGPCFGRGGTGTRRYQLDPERLKSRRVRVRFVQPAEKRRAVDARRGRRRGGAAARGAEKKRAESSRGRAKPSRGRADAPTLFATKRRWKERLRRNRVGSAHRVSEPGVGSGGG